MKVLMLGWELPPHNSGGLGVACYQLCQSLAANDADIEFVLPYEAPHDISFMKITAARPQGVAEVIKAGGAYDSHKYVYQDGQEAWVDIYGQQQLYEQAITPVIENKSFDVIHAHDWLTFRAALRAKEVLKCPLILHVHSVESDRAGGVQGNLLVHEIEETALQLADQILAVSQLTKNAIMRDYDIPADKIQVVHNSIDQTSFNKPEPENIYNYLVSMKQRGYRVVTNVGRLTVQKNLPNLLCAAQLVLEQRPKTIFLIVGMGEQLHELLELSAELGISKNVIFTGFQRGQAWRDAFQIADLFVMPSVSEPFGLAPLEAIGYGAPALVSRQSGVTEVLQNCLKVDFWDIDEMANQIAAVVNNDSLRDELHANAYREFEKLSWQNVSDKLLQVYQSHAKVVSL